MAVETAPSPMHRSWTGRTANPVAPTTLPAAAKSGPPFCRLFPSLPPFRPDDESLIALGKAMEDHGNPNLATSPIPSGFTYLGQFICHDITSNRSRNRALDSEPNPAPAFSSALNLDQLYGRGPQDDAELYEEDGIRLRIGHTTGRARFGVTETFANDLPRHFSPDPRAPRPAIIGDPRNDENLALAQTHVALLKFHNKVVDRLEGDGVEGPHLFKQAYRQVVQHYQSIALYDFVRRIAAASVYDDVLTHGRSVFLPNGLSESNGVSAPLEFAFAAYRFGHSMVRNAYQWNSVFNTKARARSMPRVRSLLEHSQRSGKLGGCATLPSDWIVDWRRLYDFGERRGGVRHPQLNFTPLIDTWVARKLQQLPEFANAKERHMQSLPVRDLVRGRNVGLPTGQDIARWIGAQPLTPAELTSGPQGAVITAHGFETQTPLSYYILKEAEVQQGGERLGEVGSRIIVETFHGLIEGSPHSILQDPTWRPELPSQHRHHFTMLDLLEFVDDINPLGGW